MLLRRRKCGGGVRPWVASCRKFDIDLFSTIHLHCFRSDGTWRWLWSMGGLQQTSRTLTASSHQLDLFHRALTIQQHNQQANQVSSPNTPTYNLLATSPPGAKQQGRANEPEFVAIMLTLIRLVDQKTDMLVTINVPHVIGQYEAGSVDLEHGKMGPLLEQAAKWRERVLETFEVKDWGLFGEE
jgi:hypothetical protein